MTDTSTNIIKALNTNDIEVVILANGEYPTHAIPSGLITKGLPIVCCDGAIEHLDSLGIEPLVVVGDGDSIPPHLREKYSNRSHYIEEQETNDLTKATTYCINHGFKHIAIVGATGKREDHTLGNISLLVNYGKEADVRMFTDYGVFQPVFHDTTFECFPHQQVSIFNLRQNNTLNAQGLCYPINNRNFAQWWEGTLNEAQGHTFSLQLKGEAIVFQTYSAK